MVMKQILGIGLVLGIMCSSTMACQNEPEMKRRVTTRMNFDRNQDTTDVYIFEVKTIEDSVHTVISYSVHGIETYKDVYIYNKQDQLVEHRHSDAITYRKYSPLNNDEFSELRSIDYKGRLYRLVRQKFDEDGKLMLYLKYEMNDTSKVNTRIEYKYNGDGQVIEGLHYYKDKLDLIEKWEYDSQGRLTKKSESDLGSLTTFLTYEYQPDGSYVVETRQVFHDFDYVESRQYYDAEGKEVKRFIYVLSDETSEVETTVERRYHYDDKDQLIKFEEYRNGVLRSVDLYEYEYS